MQDRDRACDELWRRADVATALKARAWGPVFVAYRAACGVTQDQLAARIGIPQSHVSAIERGARGVSKLDAVERIVRGLSIPWSALDHVDPPQAGAPAIDDESRRGEDDEVRRRKFLGLAAAATIALPSVVAHAASTRIGPEDVARFRAELDQLDQLEDRYGGARVYDLTAAAVGQLRQLRETAVFDAPIGRQLDHLIAAGSAHAAWAAYDVERQEAARAWWLEALHAADLADDEQVPLMVYVTMSMQAQVAGRGQEAVALAQRARRCAAGLPASRRLRSLIHAREAAGHATAGNQKLAWKTYASIDDDVDEYQADDPTWLAFWGRGDLGAHRYNSAKESGNLAAYEQAARDALTSVDPARFPRNQMSYQTALADALVRRGKLDEALPIVGRAVMSARTIDSVRIHRRLSDVLTRLDDHRTSPTVAGTLEWAREYLPGTA